MVAAASGAVAVAAAATVVVDDDDDRIALQNFFSSVHVIIAGVEHTQRALFAPPLPLMRFWCHFILLRRIWLCAMCSRIPLSSSSLTHCFRIHYCIRLGACASAVNTILFEKQ